MAGNQIVMIDNLIAEFQKQYPRYKEIFYVALPTGKELEWILAGGAKWRGARRMADSAVLLGDEILPTQPMRQWVLNLPFQLRFLLACYPLVLSQVLGIVHRTAFLLTPYF